MFRAGRLVLVAAVGLAGCGGSGSSRALSDPVPLPGPSDTAAAPAPSADVALPPGLTQPSIVVPAQVASGRLTGLAGHRAAGAASVWRQPDGSHIVRLDQYDVSNVSGLAVYLLPGAAADRIDGGIRLGALRANRGTVNLAIPGGTTVSPPLTVLIWSEDARLPVAHATGT